MNTETLEPVKITSPVATTACREDAAEECPPITQLKNILVPLDFSEMSLKSLRYAVSFAKQFGAKLTLAHVVQAPVYTVDFSYPVSLGPQDLGPLEKQLEGIRATYVPAEIPVDIIVRQSFIFEGVLDVARETCADLIITTTHGHTGLKHLFLGSVAENIVRRAPCPVLVVREIEHDFV
jgi:universal stress protein A